MLPSQRFGERARKAKHHLIEVMEHSVSNARLAELVAEVLGTEPLTSVAVSNWIRLGTMPDTNTVWALATVCGVRPAWLALDDGPMLAEPRAEAELRLGDEIPTAITTRKGHRADVAITGPPVERGKGTRSAPGLGAKVGKRPGKPRGGQRP